MTYDPGFAGRDELLRGGAGDRERGAKIGCGMTGRSSRRRVGMKQPTARADWAGASGALIPTAPGRPRHRAAAARRPTVAGRSRRHRRSRRPPDRRRRHRPAAPPSGVRPADRTASSRRCPGARFAEIPVDVDRAEPEAAPAGLRRRGARGAEDLDPGGRLPAADRRPGARPGQVRTRHGRAPVARRPGGRPGARSRRSSGTPATTPCCATRCWRTSTGPT